LMYPRSLSREFFVSFRLDLIIYVQKEVRADIMDEAIRLTTIRQRGGKFELSITTFDTPIIVDEEVVHRFRLVEGIVLTRPQLEQLTREAELVACDRETARLLGLREHSVGELEFKLRRKEFSDDAVKATIQKYRQLSFLDDTQYARKVVEMTLKRNPAGRAFLIALLRKKRVGRLVAERTVDMILRETDEVEIAKRSLEKRWSQYRQLELERARTKAYTYLSRRGISYEAARAAFDELYNRK
jgi:regulatory protein